jgi:hypothetical protein
MYETTVRTLGETSTAEAYTSSHADVKAYRAYSAFDARELLESASATGGAGSGSGSAPDPRTATIGRAFQGGKGWVFPTAAGGLKASRLLSSVGEGPTRKRTLQDRARP